MEFLKWSSAGFLTVQLFSNHRSASDGFSGDTREKKRLLISLPPSQITHNTILQSDTDTSASPNRPNLSDLTFTRTFITVSDCFSEESVSAALVAFKAFLYSRSAPLKDLFILTLFKSYTRRCVQWMYVMYVLLHLSSLNPYLKLFHGEHICTGGRHEQTASVQMNKSVLHEHSTAFS